MSNESVINPTEMESKPPLIHLAAPTRSIPDIISSLRSEFRMSEFDRAEKMLLERAEWLKEEVSEMRAKCETLEKEKHFLEKQNGLKDLKFLDLEDKLKKQERESQILSQKFTEANEDIRVLNDRKKRNEERFNEICVDLEKKEKELRVELKKKSDKILELKAEIKKAEDLAAKWKKKFRECEPRIKQLEEDVSMLMSLPPVATPDNGVASNKQSKDAESVKPQSHGMVSNGDKKIRTLPGAGSTIGINGSQGQGTGHGQVIQICDSDDELCMENLTAGASALNTVEVEKMSPPIPFSAKRKRASTCNISNTSGNDDGDDILKRKLKSSKISDTDASSDSGDDSSTDSFMDEQVTRKSNGKVYEYEADMLHAFGEDDELCMSAVCALYRQEKTLKPHTPSGGRGFRTVYKINGPVLADFLTDNDSQQDVRKSVSELKQYIPNGVSSCREIARRHSKQLFELYQNKEDPFFRPS